MHKLYVFAFFITTTIVSLLIMQSTQAISGNLVISQIKVGNSSTARLVEIYNNSGLPVDITNWCLYYSTPSNATPFTILGCFDDPNPSIRIHIKANSYALLASSQLAMSSDIVLSAGLGNGVSGHVYLIDNYNKEVDRVGWGEAVNAEGNLPVITDFTKVIERRKDAVTGLYIDTDNNQNDFINSTLRKEYQYGTIYDIVDICSNIDGLQDLLPTGYIIDEKGNCSLDIVDICQNIEGLQQILPFGYKLINSKCMLDLLPLRITELLPNAIGSDEGGEFIEIFNPNTSDIYLTNYYLYISSSGTKYSFPVGSHINAGQYLVFSNDDIKFTLINTISGVSLYSIDDQLINETPTYENPKDGEAWALINDNWQYTNRPTPGSENVVSVLELEETAPIYSELESCAVNQYRSLETNRCRLIVSSSSTLASCKDGQYRSEETNRCRSIASDANTLVPCAEGQERNPATNRCRSVTSVLGANDLVPCKEGQERNHVTNRCRNVVSAMPQADYAPEQTSENVNNNILWWSLVAVGIVAVIYGIWEWRQEIIGFVKKVKQK